MQAPIAAGMEIPIKIDPNDPQRIAKTYGGAANQAMAQAMENLKSGTGGPTAPVADDTQTRLEKLEQLRSSGLIDEQKYQEKKQKIIDEL
jgi:hypothetical protein